MLTVYVLKQTILNNTYQNFQTKHVYFKQLQNKIKCKGTRIKWMHLMELNLNINFVVADPIGIMAHQAKLKYCRRAYFSILRGTANSKNKNNCMSTSKIEQQQTLYVHSIGQEQNLTICVHSMGQE